MMLMRGNKSAQLCQFRNIFISRTRSRKRFNKFTSGHILQMMATNTVLSMLSHVPHRANCLMADGRALPWGDE